VFEYLLCVNAHTQPRNGLHRATHTTTQRLTKIHTHTHTHTRVCSASEGRVRQFAREVGAARPVECFANTSLVFVNTQVCLSSVLAPLFFCFFIFICPFSPSISVCLQCALSLSLSLSLSRSPSLTLPHSLAHSPTYPLPYSNTYMGYQVLPPSADKELRRFEEALFASSHLHAKCVRESERGGSVCVYVRLCVCARVLYVSTCVYMCARGRHVLTRRPMPKPKPCLISAAPSVKPKPNHNAPTNCR
jgi:hypothetical protein